MVRDMLATAVLKAGIDGTIYSIITSRRFNCFTYPIDAFSILQALAKNNYAGCVVGHYLEHTADFLQAVIRRAGIGIITTDGCSFTLKIACLFIN
jgi:hypothetical protein